LRKTLLSQAHTKITNLFWDLDGTIIDPKVGIISSYQEVCKEYGIPVPDEKSLFWVIGPPLRGCLAKILNLSTAEDIEQAVIRYRHWYVNEKYMLKDPLYPNIVETLETLSKRKLEFYICTSKAQAYAATIIQHHGLAKYFKGIYGSELDGTRSNKTELIAWMLKEMPHLNPSEILMIGDRMHDVKAAHDNGIKAIGVLYGYGSEEELQNHHADCLAKSPMDLAQIAPNQGLE
jgi:phosphoglycolate phosphatase